MTFPRQDPAALEGPRPRADAWRELRGRLAAWRRFRVGVRNARAAAPAAAVGAWPGADGVDALWIVEGWAYGRARRRLAAGRPADVAFAERGPRRWLVPLRCGGALAIAAADPRLALALGGERRLLIWEAVGFLASVRRRSRRSSLSAAAAAAGPGCAHAFWHGVGRGLYFAPRQLLPRPRAGCLESVRRGVPARRVEAATAGLTLAAVLANVARPPVAARWVAAAGAGEGVAAGLAAAAAIWLRGTGAHELPTPLAAAARRMRAPVSAKRAALEGGRVPFLVPAGG